MKWRKARKDRDELDMEPEQKPPPQLAEVRKLAREAAILGPAVEKELADRLGKRHR